MNEQKRCIICGKVTGSAEQFCSTECRAESIERDRQILTHGWEWYKLAPVMFEGLI